MLEVSNIDAYYGDVQALWNVSFTVQDNEIVAIFGSNGAGKTTILKIVSGLLKPATGNINFQGIRLDKEPAHRIVELGICMVPEGKRLFLGMSVLENLELGAFNSKARDVKNETLKLVYDVFPVLEARKKQAAGTLSGGQQQMLAIGRGLMSKAKLLLLDEPSLGLAPLTAQRIFEVIGQIKRVGMGILLVEQNVRIALEMANRAYLVESGHIVRHGDGKGLLKEEHIRDAYLGTKLA
jgi:branched-chain amino acid transport system ATP-binding protein